MIAAYAQPMRAPPHLDGPAAASPYPPLATDRLPAIESGQGNRIGSMFGLKLKRSKVPKPLDEPVDFSQEFFSRPGSDGFTARWADVRQIIGYKVDLFSWDEIRLDFHLSTGLTVVITEESPGFDAFMNEVQRRFPSLEGWHAKLSQPPFAASRAILYAEPEAQ